VPAEPLSSDDDRHSALLPILVNIEDLLEDSTGGLLKSTVHRVALQSEIALVPVPSKLVSSHVKKTGKTTRRDGRRLRLKTICA
jgi:hypothetical protein